MAKGKAKRSGERRPLLEEQEHNRRYDDEWSPPVASSTTSGLRRFYDRHVSTTPPRRSSTSASLLRIDPSRPNGIENAAPTMRILNGDNSNDIERDGAFVVPLLAPRPPTPPPNHVFLRIDSTQHQCGHDENVDEGDDEEQPDVENGSKADARTASPSLASTDGSEATTESSNQEDSGATMASVFRHFTMAGAVGSQLASVLLPVGAAAGQAAAVAAATATGATYGLNTIANDARFNRIEKRLDRMGKTQGETKKTLETLESNVSNIGETLKDMEKLLMELVQNKRH